MPKRRSRFIFMRRSQLETYEMPHFLNSQSIAIFKENGSTYAERKTSSNMQFYWYIK